ncbi:phage major tail protein, TP901-1 family [Lutibaculum baratangense]|uniref:Tail protein n=1 Tax=Lutibaculum baratangense AMV1 TaxID=631454 RepID=V4QSP3_9HYPH|nr:phage major tail protein, TP901-1 family [Lutibaculum baratangense]ESR22797.1 tail protein [Lutibaculum baratangense AMV1]
MTAQRGRDLLLKVDADGDGGFVTVAGLRTRTLVFNAQTIDITDIASAGQWRELLDGGGIRRCAISGAGIFKDQASDAAIRQCFFDGTIRDWQVTIPDFGRIEGPFQIASLEFGARHDAELTFDIALESAGAMGFTAI